jgi:hypothetical protein
MAKLYYSVVIELEDGSVTGNKTITGYVIKDNDLCELFSFDVDLSEQSKVAIQDHLDITDEETKFEMILL